MMAFAMCSESDDDDDDGDDDVSVATEYDFGLRSFLAFT